MVEFIAQALLGPQEFRLPESLKMTPLARLEWEHLQQALTAAGCNSSAAARLLGTAAGLYGAS